MHLGEEEKRYPLVREEGSYLLRLETKNVSLSIISCC